MPVCCTLSLCLPAAVVPERTMALGCPKLTSQSAPASHPPMSLELKPFPCDPCDASSRARVRGRASIEDMSIPDRDQLCIWSCGWPMYMTTEAASDDSSSEVGDAAGPKCRRMAADELRVSLTPCWTRRSAPVRSPRAADGCTRLGHRLRCSAVCAAASAFSLLFRVATAWRGWLTLCSHESYCWGWRIHASLAIRMA